MSSDQVNTGGNPPDPGIAIQTRGLSKIYRLYNRRSHRMREALHPLGKTYHRKFHALRDVNLTVRKGEILGIVGRNGAGKSTLLQILTGVLEPSSGDVEVNGNVTALLELGTGFNPELTGLENIYFHGTIKGNTKQEMDEILDEILGFAEIGDFIHQPLKTYSSGMRARLGFAVAAHMNPQILILDEVLAVGDELFRRKCFAKMEEIFRAGCTVLYVSHGMETITQICSRAILLDGGELILDSPPKLVTESYRRLLFAPPEKSREIRNRILRLNENEIRKVMLSGDSYDESTLQIQAKAQDEPRAYHVAGYDSKSRILTRYMDVDILDLSVTTRDEQEVNFLVSGEEYMITYRIAFGMELDCVNCGIGIKTEKGVNISARFHPGFNKFIPGPFYKGDILTTKWKLHCRLTAGRYYIDCAVRSRINGEDKLLVRITDALVFHVQKEVPHQCSGLAVLIEHASCEICG